MLKYCGTAVLSNNAYYKCVYYKQTNYLIIWNNASKFVNWS